jgi:hypothetical protein
VKPGDVTLIGCVLPCPATKPTTSSLAMLGVTEPEPAVVPVFDVPADTSSGLTFAMPANSWTSNATDAAEFVVAVTVVTDLALGEYHISPSELCPAAKNAPILIQVLPPESVTDVMGLVAPV